MHALWIRALRKALRGEVARVVRLHAYLRQHTADDAGRALLAKVEESSARLYGDIPRMCREGGRDFALRALGTLDRLSAHTEDLIAEVRAVVFQFAEETVRRRGLRGRKARRAAEALARRYLRDRLGEP